MMEHKFDRPASATGNNCIIDLEKEAADDAMALMTAVVGLASGVEVHIHAPRSLVAFREQFPNLVSAMLAITRRAGNPEYIGYVRMSSDYREAMEYVVAVILSAPNESVWYEMKRVVIQFMFHTADRTVMLNLRRLMGYGPKGLSRLDSMLRYFATFSFEIRMDAQMVVMVERLRERALRM